MAARILILDDEADGEPVLELVDTASSPAEAAASIAAMLDVDPGFDQVEVALDCYDATKQYVDE